MKYKDIRHSLGDIYHEALGTKVALDDGNVLKAQAYLKNVMEQLEGLFNRLKSERGDENAT